MTIKITLSAANMGPNATEADFDAWASYVAANIEEALGIDVEVDQFGFTGRTSAGEDAVGNAEPDQIEAIESWLRVTGWEEFCSAQGAAA